MKRTFLILLLFLWNPIFIHAETSDLEHRLVVLKRFLGDPASVEKSWLIESLPAWKKEEESRLETYLKKILSSSLENSSQASKEALKAELRKVPNLGGIRVRNQKSTLFHLVRFGTEFPNLSQIRSFQIKDSYVDYYVGRQGGTSSVEFSKTGLACAFYYFSEDETLLYSQESSEWKIPAETSFGELNSFFKAQNQKCQGCEKIRLADGTLFFFPSQNSIPFWLRWTLGFLLVIGAFAVTIFFFRSFLLRNKETLRRAVQAQKTLDQEKKSILSQ
ncbi:hypothetical protein LFX25_08920 [Leptospira sp. FAT2]|uniref:hypothetical protein n=1 Tax=Leptospira sanjuanensis TaxID=2879643 RepID=UPI001EE88D3E|nr:hypothetical protein [Leptospira sanjuanensis]MCG6193362.1 hypothetical protein [Leptospira sanjuanensis]